MSLFDDQARPFLLCSTVSRSSPSMTAMILVRCVCVWSAWWREEEKLVESSPPSPASPWRYNILHPDGSDDLDDDVDEENNDDDGATLFLSTACLEQFNGCSSSSSSSSLLSSLLSSSSSSSGQRSLSAACSCWSSSTPARALCLPLLTRPGQHRRRRRHRRHSNHCHQFWVKMKL